ncbi:MAG: hypothetical protein ABIM99_05280 [Candidatus Dojkabacteria bacterium]
MFSCTTKYENGSPCFQPYTIKNLFENYDSLRFITETNAETTGVWDTLHNQEEGSYYVFDKNGYLQFYGYLEDSTNAYSFGITFDSIGNEIKKTGGDVIRWFISKNGNDSLAVSFFLLKINRSYGGITLTGADFSKQVSLFEGYPSNIIGAKLIISKHQEKTIIMSGEIRYDCSMKKRNIKDSLRIPEYLTK